MFLMQLLIVVVGNILRYLKGLIQNIKWSVHYVTFHSDSLLITYFTVMINAQNQLNPIN